jgi:hypothetical protein
MSPDYRFRWDNYDHPNLVAAFDMSTRTPAGLMKNLAKTGAVYDAVINGAFVPANPLIRAKRTPCMDFGGVNEYLSLANPISGLVAFSIVCWANIDTSNRMIFSNDAVFSQYLYYYPTLNKVQLGCGGAAPIPPITEPIVPTNTTVMIAATKSPTHLGTVFINGKPVVVTQLAASPVVANAFIGQYTGGIIRFDGRLDNMMFYNIALTPAQIVSIFRSANPR